MSDFVLQMTLSISFNSSNIRNQQFNALLLVIFPTENEKSKPVYTEVKKLNTLPFKAVVTIGLEEGYTGIPVSKEIVIKHVQSFQTRLISDKAIYLSAKVSDCTIILVGQQEPHLQLSFINYPKFPLEIDVLKREIQALAEYLCKETKQNRIVIEFDDETVMLEIQTEIDPRINS